VRLPHSYRTWSAAVTVLVVSSTVFAVSTPASAEAPRQIREFVFDSNQLGRLARPLQGSTHSAQARERASTFLEDQTRTGRLVDAAGVRVYDIPDPLRAGKTLTLVTDGPVAATRIDYVESRRGTGDVVTAAGLQTVEVDELAAGTSTTFSGGYLAGSTSNMTTFYNGRFNQGCGRFIFGLDQLESCWQKFRNPANIREYVYNRWALYTLHNPADSLGDGDYLVDYTIRSRQWKGYDRIQQTTDWEPPGGSENCSEVAQLTITVGAVGVSAPIRKCSSHTLLLDTTPKTSLIGLDWNGRSRQQQHRLDAGAGYISRGSDVPVWADYTWVTTQYCSSWITCDPSYSYVQKDSGW
jgi:hypothetical protein